MSKFYTKLYFFILKSIFKKNITQKNSNLQRKFYIKCSKNGTINLSNNVRSRYNLFLNVNDHGHIPIGDNCFFNRNCSLHCHDSISIGENTIFGENVQLYDHDHKFNTSTNGILSGYNTAPITIGKNCWIGANVTILKSTKIGNNCLIAAGSIVKGVIPDNSLMYNKVETTIKLNYTNV